MKVEEVKKLNVKVVIGGGMVFMVVLLAVGIIFLFKDRLYMELFYPSTPEGVVEKVIKLSAERKCSKLSRYIDSATLLKVASPYFLGELCKSLSREGLLEFVVVENKKVFDLLSKANKAFPYQKVKVRMVYQNGASLVKLFYLHQEKGYWKLTIPLAIQLSEQYF